jgi:hypothetical protein
MTPRAALLASLLAAVLALGGAASARPGPGGLITTSGIGKLRLGMSARAARKVLRRVVKRSLIRRLTVRGGKYVEYEYGFGLYGPFYRVGLLGSPGSVALLRTFERPDRTREGVHVGVSERKVLVTYGRRLRCGILQAPGGGFQSCTLRGRRGEIMFLMKGAAGAPGQPDSPVTVTSVVVRKRGLGISPVWPTD